MRVAPVALLALAAALILPNLGGPLLWADEGDTAVYARTILKQGLPRAWDGRTFTESDRGQRLNSRLVMVGTPWLPYYATAASFAVLGESAFAARLPFALAGIASVLLLHQLVLRMTGDRRAALLAALLLLASVQFLLFSRQCRHYSFNIALSLLTLLCFLRLRERPREPWFAVAWLLLFHTQLLPAGAVLAALGGLTAVHPRFTGLRRAFCGWLAVLLVLAVPWAVVATSGWAVNSIFPKAGSALLPRLGQLGVEALEAIPLLGWLLLLPFALRRLTRDDRALLALALAVIGGYFVLTPFLLSTRQLWDFGLRYHGALLALGAGVTGLLIARASRGNLALGVTLVALFAATHLPANAWLWPLAGTSQRPTENSIAVHAPRPGWDRLFRSEWPGYARELIEPNPGPDSRIVRFLREHAAPDEIVITNYAWEPLYFHTNLPQGLKLLPDYPVSAAARAAGLPEYVFGVEGARWLVWRWLWNGYLEYDFDTVARELRAGGASLELVASFPDSRWENRPELHFHRFPGGTYAFPFGIAHEQVMRRGVAQIFRVSPPAKLENGEPDESRVRDVF